MRWRNKMAAFGLAALSTVPAGKAAEFANSLTLDPPQWEFDGTELQLGGFAAGALFAATQEEGPAYPGYDPKSVSGLITGNIRLRRILDNGMILGARSDLLLYRDELSGDNYGNDTVQKLYLFAQTGFGRLELGEQDGASAALSLKGPIVAREVNLAARAIGFFRDPISGDAFAQTLAPTIDVYPSSNFAKIVYVSPRLFGIQGALSFTPNTVRSPLPFTGNPSDAPDQQQNIVEVAAGYTGYFSDMALGLSAAYAHGALKNRTPGFDDLFDWSLGAQIAYTLSDVKLSAGGGYRETNAYLLNPSQALKNADTRLVHLSATAEWSSWIGGFEFSHGDADGPTDYTIAGYEAALGYKLNSNLQLTGGWQWYNYRRNTGVFYNGQDHIAMNAGFLSLAYAL